ncbi:hypothetical protein Cgig2_003194 [Carnegiea gigantea]|uniref:Uncharacterized protein n=1 Tax=Carnegiea gigantea TaxID=171969 RepID=A0A9Q1JFK5_9CARY|nr:hypothetical protein Cgig2_003194 [Carnegiea gigantea]
MKEPPDLSFLQSVLVVLPCSYEPVCSSDPAMMPYSGLLPCTTTSDSSAVVMDHGPLRSISSNLWVRSDALYGSMGLLFLCQAVPCFSLVAMDMPCMWCFRSHEFAAPYDDDCSCLINSVRYGVDGLPSADHSPFPHTVLQSDGSLPPLHPPPHLLLLSARPQPGGICLSEHIPNRMLSPSTDPNLPSSKDKGKAILVEHDSDQVVPCLSASPMVHPLSEAAVFGLPIPLTTEHVPPPFSTHMPVNAVLPEATQSFSPTSPLDTLYSPSHDISSSSHGFVQAMECDGEENDMYLELDDLNDAMLSTDSSKKRKLEEGDECSSHRAN